MPIITCPTDCTSLLPIVDFDACAPNVNPSEITKIYVAKPSVEAFTNWELAPEWVERISQVDVVSPDAIRPLTVIADKPAPAPVVKEISNSRRIVLRKDHTLNVTIDDVSTTNYEFARSMECGGQIRFWYETAGGFLFGGNEGIEGTLVLDNILNRGRDETETLAGTITWSAKFSPERTLSPIAS